MWDNEVVVRKRKRVDVQTVWSSRRHSPYVPSAGAGGSSGCCAPPYVLIVWLTGDARKAASTLHGGPVDDAGHLDHRPCARSLITIAQRRGGSRRGLGTRPRVPCRGGVPHTIHLQQGVA